jgi:hypothetical protein
MHPKIKPMLIKVTKVTNSVWLSHQTREILRRKGLGGSRGKRTRCREQGRKGKSVKYK